MELETFEYYSYFFFSTQCCFIKKNRVQAWARSSFSFFFLLFFCYLHTDNHKKKKDWYALMVTDTFFDHEIFFFFLAISITRRIDWKLNNRYNSPSTDCCRSKTNLTLLANNRIMKVISVSIQYSYKLVSIWITVKGHPQARADTEMITMTGKGCKK